MADPTGAAAAPPPPPGALPLPARRLPALLGTWFGVAVAVGCMIGAGILRAPHDVAARLPSTGFFLGVWVLGGVYALLGANALAEPGAMRPRSGGQYALVQHSVGPFAAFVVGWNDWLSSCASMAVVAFVFADAAEALLGLPVGPAARGGPPWETWLALGATVAVTLVVWRGPRAADRAQRLTSAAKAVAFLLLVGAWLLHGATRGQAAAEPLPAMPAGGAMLGALVVALQGVIFAYDGWVGVLYFGEEVRDPGREIPRALFGGVLSVMLLYLLVNAALLAVLPLGAIARDPIPAAAAAGVALGSAGETAVRLLVIVALPSTLVAILLMASRVAFALGRDAPALRLLARTDAGGSPRAALVASALVTAAFVATGTYDRVIALCAFLFVASYAISFAGVFVLRHREPEAHRPWKAWGHPWTTGLVLAGSLAFLAGTVAAAPRDAMVAVGLVVVAWPVWRLMRRD